MLAHTHSLHSLFDSRGRQHRRGRTIRVGAIFSWLMALAPASSADGLAPRSFREPVATAGEQPHAETAFAGESATPRRPRAVAVAAPRAAPAVQTDPYEVLAQIGHALELIEREYYEAPDQNKLEEGAIRGMLSGLDPHSSYFNKKDLSIFEGSTSGKFGGIGVEVEFADGQIIVIAPIEGSPADRAGVMPGDQIVAIDDQPLLDVPPHEVVGLMRGAIGSKLRLVIRQARDDQLRQIELLREQIAVASVRAQTMVGDVGYFRIKAFQDGTHREFLQSLAGMRKEGPISGLILDLRNNPGGLVRQATALADEFLNQGVIFSIRHRGRIVRREEAQKGGAYTTGGLAVLINEYSASAAELVAGALKDHGRAQLFGAQSFGKGSVQTLLPLTRGGALKLTTALYYTPSGRTTQALGVMPQHIIDPGYETGAALGALREEDLRGHLTDPEVPSSEAVPRDQVDPHPHGHRPRGLPPTNEELHLGVARTVPLDPTDSSDVALCTAYLALLGLEPSDDQCQLRKDAEPEPEAKPSATDPVLEETETGRRKTDGAAVQTR